jgi:tRNA (adenine57-N1/adenine58-N1)-methyltransferase
VREGELVYLLDDKGKRHFLQLGKGMLRVPGLGVVDGSKLLADEEGDRVGIAGREFVMLRPRALELMDSLERGAQVIIPKDAATIVFRLGIAAGDTVIEAGVGSGSLTLALLSAVGPDGRVVSIELREDHASKAKRNVERTGLQDRWSLVIGNAREITVEKIADALVMDLPAPWESLPNLERFLRPGGRVCCYIPNVNQLEETVKALRSRAYVEVEALENIQRVMEVHEGGVRPSFEMLGHTGYLVFARRASPGAAKA